jgi:hypothetical protein
MRRDHRFQLALGLAVGTSLAFLYTSWALAVATSVTIQLRGQTTGPFLYWTFVVLVLLVAVASRLKICVRDEDTVAGLGGDGFAIPLEQAPATMSRSGSPTASWIGASVGVTVSDAVEVDAVLREADVAMYMAKARGKGRFEPASAGGALDRVGTIPET